MELIQEDSFFYLFTFLPNFNIFINILCSKDSFFEFMCISWKMICIIDHKIYPFL